VSSSVKAIVFEPSVPRFLMTKALGRYASLDPAGSLRLADVPDPALPGPDWVRVKVIAAGICGSDTGALSYKASPDLSGLVSFPSVMGHEMLGRVVETGPGATRVKVGDRVKTITIVTK